MGGVATIPFYDIWGKALPSTVRGRFFGHRQFWGGILAVQILGGAGALALPFYVLYAKDILHIE